MPVYVMIFRRLKAAGADWVYHFPEIGIVELARADDVDKAGAEYSVSQAAVAELKAQKRRAEVEQFGAELREANARARETAGVRARSMRRASCVTVSRKPMH